MESIRLHDFRRTFATFLYRHTHDDYLVKKCINHVNPSVTGIYVRITYEDMAKAIQAQADRFYQLAYAKGDTHEGRRRLHEKTHAPRLDTRV